MDRGKGSVMEATMSKFDAVKFRKVREMMDRGATEGERSAAKGRAEALAANTGWDLFTAIQFDDAQLRRSGDTSARSSTAQAQDDHFAKMRAKREARFREAVRMYGPSEKACAETNLERLLRLALEPIAVRSKYSDGSNTYVSGFGKWTVGAPGPDVLSVLGAASPLPTDIAAAMAEWQAWEDLTERRFAYDPDYDSPIHTRCRVDAIEAVLDSAPAKTWDEFNVRMTWRRRSIERDRWHTLDEDLAQHDRLASDLAFLSTLDSGPVQTGQQHQQLRRTNAEKRQAVLDLLATEPNLSDRQAAKRAGVSPQTVNTWRKKSRPCDLAMRKHSTSHIPAQRGTRRHN